MKKEYVLGLMTVLFWSTSATAFELTLRYLDVFQVLFYGIITSTVILGAYLKITGKFDTVFGLRRREYGFYLGLGCLNPLVYYLMVIKAYDLLPAQIVQPINYTWVITLSLMAVPLLKQPLGKIQMIATLISYAGVVVISLKGQGGAGEPMNYVGVFLAVGCTLIWALYWILNIRSRQDPVVAIFLNFFFSIPLAALLCCLFSSVLVSDPKGLLGAVWIGCFELGFAFITWISALKLSGNTGRVANLVFLTPFISLIFICFVLGEVIEARTWAGLFLILIGIGIQKYQEFRMTSGTI
nr:DMT family transporter [uncultured Desulfobacter sp.]